MQDAEAPRREKDTRCRHRSITLGFLEQQATVVPHDTHSSTLDNAEIPGQTQVLRLNRPSQYLRPTSHISLNSDMPLRRPQDFEDVLRGIDRQLELPISPTSIDLTGANGKPVAIQVAMNAFERGECSTEYLDRRLLPAGLRTLAPKTCSQASYMNRIPEKLQTSHEEGAELIKTDHDWIHNSEIAKDTLLRTSFDSWRSGQTQSFFEDAIKSLEEASNHISESKRSSSYSVTGINEDLQHGGDDRANLTNSFHRPKRSVSMIAVANPLLRAASSRPAPPFRHSLSQGTYLRSKFTFTKTGRPRLPPEWVEQQRSRLPDINTKDHPAFRARAISQARDSLTLTRSEHYENTCRHLSNRDSCTCTIPTSPTTARQSNCSTIDTPLTPFTSPASSLTKHRHSTIGSTSKVKFDDSAFSQIMTDRLKDGQLQSLRRKAEGTAREETVFAYWDTSPPPQRQRDHSPQASYNSSRLSDASSTCLLGHTQSLTEDFDSDARAATHRLRRTVLEAEMEGPYANPFEDPRHTDSSLSIAEPEKLTSKEKSSSQSLHSESKPDDLAEQHERQASPVSRQRPLSTLSSYLNHRGRAPKEGLTGGKVNREACYARMQALLCAKPLDTPPGTNLAFEDTQSPVNEYSDAEENTHRAVSAMENPRDQWSHEESKRRWSGMGGSVRKNLRRTVR
ncbi:uncharacterized protein KY384_007034 [Bacidia gigantensis]|uniref:uncharacterized protein n=1 Tax=Bacidia gigantensis TaxID=2732470 RepID=UPI001D05B731|nr:uncharacterized protein KY384_007034 [Bacidia gigantensis]KAG8528118.1 hypothetical protein KY384_007034 [Bacidia gigantensis]